MYIHVFYITNNFKSKPIFSWVNGLKSKVVLNVKNKIETNPQFPGTVKKRKFT